MMSRLFAASLVACVLAGACFNRPRGQLMLAIDTDMSAGTDFDRLRIEVLVKGVPQPYTNTWLEFGRPGQIVTFPTTFGIVENSDPTTSIHIRVITGLAGGANPDVGTPMPLREIITPVPDDRTVLLRVRLDWLCSGYSSLQGVYIEGGCNEGQTCIAGSCVDWTVDSKMLPTFDERDVFGGGTRKGDGACFDTLPCFEQAMTVAPDNDCTFPKPAGDVNVALVPQKGQGGICAGDSCIVPLDKGAPFGWTEASGRVVLPQAVCVALKDFLPGPVGADGKHTELRLRAILVSTRCPAKPASLPTCGPWSTVTTKPGGDASIPLPPSDAGLDGG